MGQTFKRRAVREKVLQLLYSYEMNKDGFGVLKEEFLSEISSENDLGFADSLINRVIIHRDEIDGMIKERVDNWEMNRIALIDKILLRMGICELLFFPDIPPKVSINESIEIAKNYSTASSGKFINGILDAILSELKGLNKLNKIGRGLLEESLPKSSQKNHLDERKK